MDLDGTSKLSPYLRFGMLSARQAAWAARAAMTGPEASLGRGPETWLNELIWREFYLSILYHFPASAAGRLSARLRDIAWRNDPAAICRLGEGPDRLSGGGCGHAPADRDRLDAQPGAHDRGLVLNQRPAGGLALGRALFHAAPDRWRSGRQQRRLAVDRRYGHRRRPYFRIFNPSCRARSTTREGTYVRRWLPELAGVPDQFIHEPWKAPGDVQRQAGCIIGKDYPRPIVDHAAARQLALAAYKH